MQKQIIIPYWLHQKTGKKFIVGEYYCGKCDCKIETPSIVRIIALYGKNNTELFYYCQQHHAEGNTFLRYNIQAQDHFCILIEDISGLPGGCVFRFIKKTPLVTGKYNTVFDAAVENDNGIQIIDNTKYSKNQSIEGAKIGGFIDYEKEGG